MDKYLHEILLAHLSVILPELGALTQNENNKEIIFNPYIKFNDEKFELFLVEKYQIEKQAAANMIAQYVQEIKNQLNKGETFTIFQLGRFVKNSSGEIEFNNWNEFYNANEAAPADKKSVASETNPNPAKEPKTESKVESKVEAKKADAPEVPLVQKKEEKKPATENLKKENKYTEIKKEKELAKTKPVKEKPIKTPKEKTDRKKRGVFFYINIALALLLIGTGIFVGLNFAKVQKMLGFTGTKKELVKPNEYFSDTSMNAANDSAIMNNETVADTNSILNSDSTESKEIEEEIPSKVVETSVPNNSEPTPSSSSGTYHLIGGGFKNAENAERFAQSLQAKGLSSHLVGVFDGLSLVAIQSYPTLEEAKAAIDQVASQSGISKPWIFKH